MVRDVAALVGDYGFVAASALEHGMVIVDRAARHSLLAEVARHSRSSTFHKRMMIRASSMMMINMGMLMLIFLPVS